MIMIHLLSMKGLASSLAVCISSTSTGVAGFTNPSFSLTQQTKKCPSNNFHCNGPLSSSTQSVGLDYIAIDIAEHAERNILAMDVAWAPQHGIQRVDGFKLAEEDKGREVYASTTHDVPAGTPLLYVPEEVILSSNKAIAELRSPDMALAEEYVINSGAESELRHYYSMLKILLEIQNEKDSPWFQWLNSLPRHLTNAASMTDYCLLCLPPLMKKLAGDERENQQRLSTDSIKMVPFLSDDIKMYPRDLVKWAYQIVYTRSVETEDGDLKIVPMADYFNHGSDYTEIEPSYDENGNYYAYASYDVPAGSALRISYADPRNPSHLLARYGFLDEQCPAAYCKLLPPTVNQDMLDLGYSHDRMLFYSTGEVADEVWDIFLYDYLSNSANIDEQQALMNAHNSGDYDTKIALHEMYYPQTSAALLEHVDNFIDDIDKLITKAERIGVSDPDSVWVLREHPRLPLIHKHNIFVRETFQNVRNRYSTNEDFNWREASRVTVQECDDSECAIAECEMTYDGDWACEGGLGDRPKFQTVISSQ